MYSVVVKQDEYSTGEVCYVAEHPELPGCMGCGGTPAEAQADLDEAREAYLASLHEDGLPIPISFDQRVGTQGADLTFLLAIDVGQGRWLPWQDN
jgi:predicted RNase H-like HicB family nuclease